MKNKIFLFCIFFCGLIYLTSCTNKYKSVVYLIDKNKFDKAILILTKMNNEEKDSFEYNFLSGTAYLGKSISGYKRDSLNYFLRAEQYLPNDYNNLLIISKLYQEVNDYKNAKIYADKALEYFDKKNISKYSDDVHFVLAKICFHNKDYKSALQEINKVEASFINSNEVKFFRYNIESRYLKNDSFETFYYFLKKEKNNSIYMIQEYVDYCVEFEKYDEVKKIAQSLIVSDSDLEKYFGSLYSGFLCMLENNLNKSISYIEQASEYNVDDSLFFKRKIELFYKYLIEENKLKVFNSYLLYRFFYEKNDNYSNIAKDDLTEMEEYFFEDIYFQKVKILRKK